MRAEPVQHERSVTHVVRESLIGRDALTLPSQLARLPLDDIDEVTLSLRWVGDVDASGVAALVRAFSHLEQLGKRLRLVDVPAHVHDQLRTIGLADLLPVNARPVTARRRWFGRRDVVAPDRRAIEPSQPPRAR
ncbi:MAG: STAS domain-containing protein [Myxococcales bacterium]|nr:STAS domain-containing protein [Myxococcales bacterium]MCB9539162.1 STAS domain-containing protein [Myxococcales bacterium]